MTIESSGALGLNGTCTGGSSARNQIGAEVCKSAGTALCINNSSLRTLSGTSSGTQVSFSNFYGKSNRVTVNLSVGSTANYTLNTAKVSGYIAGKTCVNFTINSGAQISSGSTGSYAFVVGSCFTSGDVIKITNNGTILGRGGNGGNAGFTGACSGSSGGPGLQVNFPTTIKNSGRISSGGGGGGGGAPYSYTCDFTNVFSSGGGGGGGIGNSSGGYSPACGTVQNPGSPGSGGSFTSAGGGGSGGSAPAGSGGPGGGYGSSGNPGGTGNQGSRGSGGGTGTAINGYSKISFCGGTGTINGPTNG
jgi:hypothetical protein